MTDLKAGIVDVYAIDPRADGWRVLVLQRSDDTKRPRSWEAIHGSIDPGETPARAALRELREETGLAPHKLYSVTVHPFYIVSADTVQLAITFCAFVDSAQAVVLSHEHRDSEWLSLAQAKERLTWPRAGRILDDIWQLLRNGDAGPVEDVLRIV